MFPHIYTTVIGFSLFRRIGSNRILFTLVIEFQTIARNPIIGDVLGDMVNTALGKVFFVGIRSIRIRIPNQFERRIRMILGNLDKNGPSCPFREGSG